MKTLLKLEETAIFLSCILLFGYSGFAWWWFPALLFVPDLSMAGYAFNPKAGAFFYNLFHHRLMAIALGSYGLASGENWFQVAGILLLAHISLDRILGYGLKYNDSFNHTHLGNFGKSGSEKAGA